MPSSVLLRALGSRDLRLYFLGHGISLIGTWITTIATSWLVYRLTNSEFLLGVVAFSAQFPSAVFGPIAASYVDRLDRRRVLLVTQTLSMLQSFTLFMLAVHSMLTPSGIILLNVVQALIYAFDNPARQSFLVEIIDDRRDLPNAVGLMSALFHGSRLIGPTVAGLLIAWAGEAPCFLVDTFSYAAVLVSLCLIKAKHPAPPRAAVSAWAATKEGLAYVVRHQQIRSVLILVLLVCLLGTFHFTLVPVFAKEVFGGDSRLYGYLMGASGSGAFLGAMYIASRERGADLSRITRPMPVLLGLSLFVFAWSPLPILAGAAIFMAAFAMVALMAASNSMIQMLVEDTKRARVMGLFSTCFLGAVPIGGLMAGYVANLSSAPLAVSISAVVNVVIGLWALQRVRWETATSSLQ